MTSWLLWRQKIILTFFDLVTSWSCRDFGNISIKWWKNRRFFSFFICWKTFETFSRDRLMGSIISFSSYAKDSLEMSKRYAVCGLATRLTIVQDVLPIRKKNNSYVYASQKVSRNMFYSREVRNVIIICVASLSKWFSCEAWCNNGHRRW